MNINLCKIIELPKISDPRGNLTFVEGGQHIPFIIFLVGDVLSNARKDR